jgi:hypothetical protein
MIKFKSKHKVGDILQVTWLDAYGAGLKTYTYEKACEIGLYVRKTVGHFVNETSNSITIAATLDKEKKTDNNLFEEVTVIPKGWTTKIKKMK